MSLKYRDANGVEQGIAGTPYDVMKRDGDAIDAMLNVYGAKNLLQNTAAATYTQGGITFTTNDDGTFQTTAGTPSENVNGYHISAFLVLNKGEYIISGSPVGTSMETAFLELKLGTWEGGPYAYSINGQEMKFTIENDNTVCYVRPYLVSGATLSAMTWKPMIRDARIEEDTFVPYAMTNRELALCNIYSREEVIVGKWVDGRPIYRKCFLTKTPATENVNTIVIADLGFTNVGFITRIEGYLHISAQFEPINWVWQGSQSNLYCASYVSYVDGAWVLRQMVPTNAGRTNADEFVIIEYVKQAT